MVKVKLPLCLINYAPGHEDISGSRDIAPPFFNPELDERGWSEVALFLRREHLVPIENKVYYIPETLWLL
jgi:hypothetical protein